ncbi:Histone deacetylase HOS3 domain protein [Saccharomyces cerevisiae]|nr:Histone deacetylase HOS3 domain protein [Saccharomyces cerevisiae]
MFWCFAHLIGLQNQDWVKEWGSEQVVKEIVRGCKPAWKPYKTKRAKDVIRIWAEEVIRLGRAMIPEFDDIIFKDAVNSAPSNSLLKATVEPASTSTIAQRIIRSHRSNASPEKELHENKPRSTEKQEQREIRSDTKVKQLSSNNRAAETQIPFLQQEFSSEDEDEEYVYDEELNKTFNRTVEDITIDDISRHLETLEIEKKVMKIQTMS